jgi:hypothetical protein
MVTSALGKGFPARNQGPQAAIREKSMRDQRLLNTLWIVLPALIAVVVSRHGSSVEVVARHLPQPPVALSTNQRPPSADGFFWEIRSNAHERLYRARDGRMARVSVWPGEILLWCRQAGDSVYSLAGQGPDRMGPPCLIDPPFVLRRTRLENGAAETVRDDLPSASVFVHPSGAVCFADTHGIYRIPPTGGRAELLCPRTDFNVTAWGAAGETIYWIEEAMPGSRDPVGSCRLLALDPGSDQPRTVAWAPDALTDLVVSERLIAWYHPASRKLEGVRPDGRVNVLARDINLASTPVAAGDRLYYLCERPQAGRELATTSVSSGEGEVVARLDRSTQILGCAQDGVYLSEEEGGRGWLSSPVRTGRLLRVPLP